MTCWKKTDSVLCLPPGLKSFRSMWVSGATRFAATAMSDAGPDRLEMMTEETAAECLRALECTSIPKVDITGGAPELNPNFRWLVAEARRLGRHVMDRCNLTVLLLKGQEDLAEFLAFHRVEVICSLPYFQERETDRQRGEGVFNDPSRHSAGLMHLAMACLAAAWC